MEGRSRLGISTCVGLFLAIAVVCLNCSTAQTRGPAAENPWLGIRKPTKGEKGPIGAYSAGCLDGAKSLALNGRGFQVMRPSRNRFYGHISLLDFIHYLGHTSMDEKVGVFLIGDLAMPRGGPMPSAHASHQIGLDVDVWFWLNRDAQHRPLTPEERERLPAPSFVDLEKQVLNKEMWRPEHVKILRISSEHPDTERIFVNPVIKRELCETAGSDRGWLRKIRPWFGHDDHFHVRLKCPAGSAHCQSQDAVDPGDGCGELGWWFTAEAREEARKVKESEPTEIPKLPKVCGSILKEPDLQRL